jgi:hypothetical protein
MITTDKRNEARDRRELYCTDAPLPAEYDQSVPKTYYLPITLFAGGQSGATNSDAGPFRCSGHLCLSTDYARTTPPHSSSGRGHHLSK